VRLRWQVLMSSAFGIANAVGPSLGGFLTQYYGWRSVFYVNLPVGAISLLFVWRYLPHLRHTKTEGRMRLDWPGALLIAVSLSSLQLFVEMVPKHGLTLTTAALIAASVVAGFALWRWEKRTPHAILPLDMFRNGGLNALFTLSVLSGFAMFSLLFYAPLLFQGGFGMSPKEAGVVITPLVVFITIGSIANSKTVARLRNPNMMLFIGFALLVIACLAISLATRAMPRGLMMAMMIAGGLGLGLVLPNLTVFAQQIAGREHLGISTALLQSLRMIGGMFGTALTGTLVTHLYASGVRNALDADHAGHWFAQLADPQILINREAQASLAAELAHAGHNALGLFEAARLSLVGAIHVGIAMAAVIAAVGFWQSRRVPPIRLHGKVEQTMQVD
jgi:predicted MFS family arabinose efflux permease